MLTFQYFALTVGPLPLCWLSGNVRDPQYFPWICSIFFSLFFVTIKKKKTLLKTKSLVDAELVHHRRSNPPIAPAYLKINRLDVEVGLCLEPFYSDFAKASSEACPLLNMKNGQFSLPHAFFSVSLHFLLVGLFSCLVSF